MATWTEPSSSAVVPPQLPASARTFADPYVGREVLGGEFTILEKLGAGGMGAVYLARQSSLERTVAIKILHATHRLRQDLASRFRREARAMRHLTHPNSTRVFLDGELEDGSLYIVMEHLEGRDLHQTLLTDGPFSLARAVPILAQVAGALDEAHSVGFLHRDLKPENIFLARQPAADFPKLLDFGLAKVTARETRPGTGVRTQDGLIFGTPEFMSPEQARGAPLTPASDLYSLAVIFYEMLTGKLPFEAKPGFDYLRHHVYETPIPLSARIPGITFSPLLDAVVARALDKQPESRFASASDFAEAVRLAARGARSLPRHLLPPVGVAEAASPVLEPTRLTTPATPEALRAQGPDAEPLPAGRTLQLLTLSVAIGAVVATVFGMWA